MSKILKSGCALITTAAVAFCVSCNSNITSSNVNQESEVDYALSLFRNMLQISSVEENVTLSPYSAGVALSMLAEGAEGVTRAELDKALEGCRLQADTLSTSDSVVVKSANSIWTNVNYPIKESYVKCLDEKYDATAQAVDFSAASSVESINAWARENTEGKIDKVVKELSPDMVAVLANAVYFKGSWESPFNSRDTKVRSFHGSNGDEDVPFMSQTITYDYAQYYGNQMIRIPYWGGQYAMTVILPSEGLGVDKLENYINEQYLDMANSMLKPTRVKLILPKFKVESDRSLIPVLKKMGVNTLFTPGAELGGIADENLSVSEVNQKAFVNVDERGSEAAAVTTIGVMLTSAPVQKVDLEVMDVNRPFYYMISDVNSGRILFIGRISNL